MFSVLIGFLATLEPVRTLEPFGVLLVVHSFGISSRNNIGALGCNCQKLFLIRSVG